MITILIDDREAQSGMAEQLALYSNKMKIEFTRLKTGDYHIFPGSILVERKTVNDFCHSVIDGRLFRQAYLLNTGSDKPIIIIEGNWEDRALAMGRTAIQGALLSLALTFRIPVIHTRDRSDTAGNLMMTVKQNQNRESHQKAICRNKPKRTGARQLHILQGLPGIGRQLALALVKHFGSVQRVFTAKEEELQCLSGIGPMKAARIVQLLSSPPDIAAYSRPENSRKID